MNLAAQSDAELGNSIKTNAGTPGARKLVTKSTLKGGLALKTDQAPRPTMTQAQIDKQLQYYMLESEDTKKDIFNSLTRI